MKTPAATLLAAGLAAAIVSTARAKISPGGDAAPVAAAPLWQDGANAIRVVPCSAADSDAVAIEARKDGHATRSGACYPARKFVSVAWSRPLGIRGPDVIVLGNSGGSAACGDVIAATFDEAAKLQALSFCPAEQVPVLLVGDVPEFDAYLDLGGFNGAAGAATSVGAILIAVRPDGFTADLRGMAAEPLSAEAFQRLRSVVAADLHQWAMSLSGIGAAGLATPGTLEALLNLTQAGRADQARALTFEAGLIGAGPTFRAEAFWDDFCLALVSHPLWKRLDLGRMPHADWVISAARDGQRGRKGRDYLPGD